MWNQSCLLTAALALCLSGTCESTPPPPLTKIPVAPRLPESRLPPPPEEQERTYSPEQWNQMRRARAEVGRARRLARRGQHGQALDIFERLVTESATAPRLRCEAGFVAYQTGDLERASELLDEGLRQHGDARYALPLLRVPLAQCLYNRGLVHEAESNQPEALRAYQRSVELRPNPIVQLRLDALRESGVRADPEAQLSAAAHFPTAATGADPQSTLSQLRQSVCTHTAANAQMHNDGTLSWEPIGCEASVVTVEGSTEALGGQLASIYPMGPDQQPGSRVWYALFSRGSAKFTTEAIATDDTPRHRPAEVEVQAGWLEMPDGHLFVADVRTSETLNEAGCEEGWTQRKLVLCALGESEATCGQYALGQRSWRSCAGAGPRTPAARNQEQSEEFGATVRWADGQLEVWVAENQLRVLDLQQITRSCPLRPRPWVESEPGCRFDR